MEDAMITKQNDGNSDLKQIKIVGGIFSVFILFWFLIWMHSSSQFASPWRNVSFLNNGNGQNVFASELSIKKPYSDIVLDNDTLIVLDTTAAPGDTFWVTVCLTNTTIPVATAEITIRYKKSIIHPVYSITNPCGSDTPCTLFSIEGYKTARTAELPYYVWSGYLPNNHLDTLKFNFATDAFNSPIPCLPTGGSGPIVRFKFVVDPSAIQGAKDTLYFVYWDYSTQHYANNLSDTVGTNFYIPQTRRGIFTVAGGGQPGNHCPVFTASAPADSYQVSEGQTLQFAVTSTDQDGDDITLSVDPLSPSGLNYHFTTTTGTGSVTQTFDYTPGYDEASPGSPTVRYATFRALDDQGCATTKTVAIWVINTVQDLIVAGDKEGGVPGSGGVLVPFMLTNSVDVYGFQYTFRWDASKLDVDSIVRTGAIDGFSMYTNLGDSAGKATVLVFGLAGETIPAGVDTMLYAAFSVHEDASSAEVPITLENAREAINPGDPSKTLGTVNGKFTIDMFGDVNLDRMVDVGDVVSLVSYILGEIGFTTRQLAASDINSDDLVNVGDLVAMIDIILGRWMGPSPQIYTGTMATVRLDYQDLENGGIGEVKVIADTKVPVAGAQLQIDYDPTALTLQTPRLSDRSGHFIVESHDDGKGKLKIVLYNFSNDPISAGEGTILSIPATVSPNAPQALKIELKKVVLSDSKAVLLPTEGESPSLPSTFELDQNYPNPFNPSTTIRFTVPSTQNGSADLKATLKVYNILGEVVKILVDEPLAPGTYERVWDGRDGQGNSVASGIYFYKLKAGSFTDTKKMVMMK
jgi:hypothetical protein